MLERIDYSALARRLIAQGHTTGSIARAIGVTQPSVSRVSSGKTKALSADAAIRLIRMAGGVVTLPDDCAPAVPQAEASHAG